MEYRKLISFGKSSYIVSLPKSWVLQNKLKKGDLIYFEEQNGNLLVGSKGQDIVDEKSITLNIDGKSLPQIRRELNAAYIENYHEITIKGRDVKEKSEPILEFVRDLIALEVLEVDSTKIATKDFLDMDKVSLSELVRKMDLIVRSMLKDCIECFAEKNAFNIELRDRDVNRLSFLIYRIVRYGMHYQAKMLKNFNLTPVDLLNYYWVNFHLEVIADEAKRIARAMQKVTLPKKKQQEFITLLKSAEEFYLEMIKAHYQNDRHRAFDLSNLKAPLVTAINSYYEALETQEKDTSYMVDRFRRMVSSIHELDRLTYQH